MTAISLVVAAIALSLERIAYAAIWRHPDAFRAICARRAPATAPELVLRRLFYGFKLIQTVVFASWIAARGGAWPSDVRALAAGIALIAAAQALNWSVFHRLGSVGVFYGSRFGHAVPWVDGFPFSVLSHPQYVGTVISIWGLFLATRFPHGDWLVLPLLETLYYAVGARLEREDPDGAPAFSRRLPVGHRHRGLSDRRGLAGGRQG